MIVLRVSGRFSLVGTIFWGKIKINLSINCDLVILITSSYT